MIGFGKDGEEHQDKREELERLLGLVEAKDLVEYGLIPEFVGRLPIHVQLHELGVDDLVHILVEPKNALVRQFQAYFSMEGHELKLTDEALQEVASQAHTKETGVRALRSIIEGALHDLLFSLPEYGKPSRTFVVTAEMIRQGSAGVLLEGGESSSRESA